MPDRIVETEDGETRVTETAPGTTTIIERRGGGGGLLIGLAVLVLVVIGALYLLNQNSREAAKTDAITSAAKSTSLHAERRNELVAELPVSAASSARILSQLCPPAASTSTTNASFTRSTVP